MHCKNIGYTYLNIFLYPAQTLKYISIYPNYLRDKKIKREQNFLIILQKMTNDKVFNCGKLEL